MTISQTIKVSSIAPSRPVSFADWPRRGRGTRADTGVLPRAARAFSALALGWYVSRFQRFCRFAAMKCRENKRLFWLKQLTPGKSLSKEHTSYSSYSSYTSPAYTSHTSHTSHSHPTSHPCYNLTPRPLISPVQRCLRGNFRALPCDFFTRNTPHAHHLRSIILVAFLPAPILTSLRDPFVVIRHIPPY